MKKLVGLAIAAATVSTAASAQNFTYELYAGVALEDSSGLEYGGVDYPMDSGSAFGVGVYMDYAGFEIGLDVMATDRRYTGYVSGVETTSVMINGRYPFQIAPSIEGYAGLGLGAINVKYDGSTAYPAYTGDETGTGGQVSLGARYALSATTVFAELKYQTLFEPVTIVGYDVGYDSTSLLLGIRF